MTANQNHTISALAKEFEITTRTIRFYEEKGMLRPVREGQKRIFSNADRVRLQLILRGKRIGLSLDESIEIIDMYDPSGPNAEQYLALIHKINEKKQQLQLQINDIEDVIFDLNKVQQRCSVELKEMRN